MNDLISRQDLLDKLEQWQKQDGYDNEEWNLLVDVITEIKNMPFATDIYVGTNDAISRQAAIDAATSSTMEWDGMYVQDLNGRIREAIEQLPSIQPKRSKWDRDGHHIRCEECGEWMCDTDREGDTIPINFCPNCGADMRQREE